MAQLMWRIDLVSPQASPPDAGILSNGLTVFCANRIVPSMFHAPPMATCAGADACGGPPPMSMR